MILSIPRQPFLRQFRRNSLAWLVTRVNSNLQAPSQSSRQEILVLCRLVSKNYLGPIVMNNFNTLTRKKKRKTERKNKQTNKTPKENKNMLWNYFIIYYQFFFFKNSWPWIRLYDRSCLSNSWNRHQRQWPSYTIVYACRTNRPLATYKIITVDEILRTPPLFKR